MAEATGKVLLRKPDDTDLLVPREDLELAASILGTRIASDKRVAIRTSDGHVARFAADEVTAEADTIIQMVCPTGPMEVGDHRYDTAFSDTAADARQVYETPYGVVPVATTDALFLYAALQRNSGVKDDRHNAAILRGAVDLQSPYALARADEMWLDVRALNFVYGAGSLATARQLQAA